MPKKKLDGSERAIALKCYLYDIVEALNSRFKIYILFIWCCVLV